MDFFLKNQATTVSQKAKNIGIGFIVLLAWSFIVTYLFGFMGSFGDIFKKQNIPTFFFACIVAPLWEELYYRYVPIQISKAFGHKFLMPILIFSAVNFGFGHGNELFHLFMQGVMGMIFSWVYLKNKYSYWSSVILHCLWNTFVLCGQFLVN